MTERATTVVVGASLAGVRTVQALRRRGYDARITLIGAEPELPYDRPPLSKEFLLGKIAPPELCLADGAQLAALDVELRLGVRAEALDLPRRALLAGGDWIAFETLIIATGSTPRRLPGAAHRRGVHVLRTVDDAIAIRSAFEAGARVAVVGGGFIGAEVASAARHLGLEVTVIDPVPAMMQRGVGPALGRVLSERHRDNGVRLKLGRSVARLAGADLVEQVILDDGSSVAADVVVVGIGVDPAVGWLAGSGLDVGGGLACDPWLSAAPGIYAVGDVARLAGGTGRLEHWTNAVDQAAALAATLTGSAAPYTPMPYVWSDQLGTRLQVWGDVQPGDELHYLVGDGAAEEFVATFGRAGRLRGVVAFGARRAAMRAQRMLAAGTPWLDGPQPLPEPA